jgi:DNA invertase Pin-like site-specific DNA recombinase
MPPTARAAIYARVSSAGQRDARTIESQVPACRAFCEAQGWTIAGEYIDDGKSAAGGAKRMAKRDAFARLVADATAGQFDAVVVVDMDRITRTPDQRERGEILGAFQAAGIKLAITSTGQILDLDTDIGDMMGNLGAVFAAWDNRKRRARKIAGDARVARLGRKPRGPTPLGLSYQHDPLANWHEWKVDEPSANVVREVFERCAAGTSPHRVADLLDARGVKRPRAGRWTAGRVRALVHADVYLGRFVVDRKRGLSIPVPTFIEPEVAYAARDAIAGRFRRPLARTVHHHLLNGIATCGLCGGGIGMGETTHRPDGTRPTAYRCLHRRRPPLGQPRCDLPLLHAGATDERLWSAMLDVLTDPALADRILAKLQRRDAETPDPGRHQAELARIDQAQDAVLAQLVRGDVGQAIADAQIARLAAKRRAAQVELQSALAAERGLRQATGAAQVAQALAWFRDGIAEVTPEERRQFVRLTASKVVVHGEAVMLDLTVPTETLIRTGPEAAAWSCSGAPVRLSIRVLAARGRQAV